MDKSQRQVLEFHEKFDVAVELLPTIPNQEIIDLRIALIREELGEFEHCIRSGNLIGAVDGLGDMIYVINGTAVSMGVDLEPVSDEIHRSNMSKLTTDGKVLKRADGKIMKPDTYSPANIESVLRGIYE